MAKQHHSKTQPRGKDGKFKKGGSKTAMGTRPAGNPPKGRNPFGAGRA